MGALAAAADRLGQGETPERLTRLLAERSRMLAAIGHDLRSPVTAMRLRLEMVDELREHGGRAKLSAAAEVVISARPAALKRALRNIAENAVRYAGAAEISLSREDGVACVEILDSGPGIPEAERERVFEPFVRLETSRSRQTGGAGLGLAIARTVIESHGGGVRLEAAPGGGVRVVVKLPGAQRPSP